MSPSLLLHRLLGTSRLLGRRSVPMYLVLVFVPILQGRSFAELSGIQSAGVFASVSQPACDEVSSENELGDDLPWGGLSRNRCTLVVDAPALNDQEVLVNQNQTNTAESKVSVVQDDAFQWRGLYRSEVFQTSSGQSLPYRILHPDPTLKANHDEESEDAQLDTSTLPQSQHSYPLVLFLHGAGERGDDNEKQLVHGAAEFAQLSRRRDYPCYAVFPQCPSDVRWVESDWGLTSGRDAFPASPSSAMKLALELVEKLVTDLPVDPSRIYVTGLSMGGMGAWYAAGTHPERFAAMLEVCGGGDPTWAPRYAGVPVWAFHGQADGVVPASRGREMIQALAKVGHWPEMRYVEYPGVGHNSWTQTYSRDDVFAWLFSQRKQTSR